jgi:sialate O-acetylesterase
VTSPVAVKYGWCEACEPNLFNGAGLPAIPFNSKTK